MTRRTFFLALSGLAGCARGARPRLNVYNWSEYVGPNTIADFEREFGVQVRYGIYESNEEMLAKALTGNSGWDVVFPSNYLIEPMRRNGLLGPLRHAWLDNLGQLAPRFQTPSWDPRLEWCVPYMTGASGIVFQGSLNPPPASWTALWDPRLGGRITMLDDPAEVIGACLKKLGFALNSVDPRQLDLARREAIEQKKLLRAYLNAEARDQLVSGDLLAAQLWATTSQQAMRAAPGLRFVYPAEGFALYADNAVVLRESRRQELAHRFINYLLRPAVAAEVVKSSRTATANAGAIGLLPPDLRENPVLYPPPETLRRGEWFEPLPAAGQRLRDRIWTEIKSS
ncbi:MAG: spermidine/putrescine ABC transporter substrate-binding protein [Candidatus Solibacter usitatus]|nr:spermidine/putrescine ABC transporter substrate-binding protein [Candidatus Solibacter usitatus]